MSKIEVYLVLWKTSTWPMYLPYNPTCNYSVLKQFFWAHGWAWYQFNALRFPCSCPRLYYASYSPVIRCQSLTESILYILTWWVSVLPRTRARVCLQPQLANLAFFCWMSWPLGCPGLLDFGCKAHYPSLWSLPVYSLGVPTYYFGIERQAQS